MGAIFIEADQATQHNHRGDLVDLTHRIQDALAARFRGQVVRPSSAEEMGIVLREQLAAALPHESAGRHYRVLLLQELRKRGKPVGCVLLEAATKALVEDKVRRYRENDAYIVLGVG